VLHVNDGALALIQQRGERRERGRVRRPSRGRWRRSLGRRWGHFWRRRRIQRRAWGGGRHRRRGERVTRAAVVAIVTEHALRKLSAFATVGAEAIGGQRNLRLEHLSRACVRAPDYLARRGGRGRGARAARDRTVLARDGVGSARGGGRCEGGTWHRKAVGGGDAAVDLVGAEQRRRRRRGRWPWRRRRRRRWPWRRRRRRWG
jgi:hypothetical protein